MGTSWCPQCGSDLVAPSAFDSSWRCGRHGRTLPLTEFRNLDDGTISHIRTHADVPLWFPDPLPGGWRLAGLAAVGDTRSRFRATVAAFCGPAPLGGEGEWLFVAEELGIGLGAGYAGVDATDTANADNLPSAKVGVRGHPLPVWPVPDSTPDRSAYRGEAAGVWLWLIGHPSDAGYAVLDDLGVTDLAARTIPAVETTQRSRRLRPGVR